MMFIYLEELHFTGKEQDMRTHSAKILVLLLAIVAHGCTSSQPSEADARAIFEKRWAEQLQKGTAKILTFKKVNGQAAEFMGVKIYKLDYEAEIEYPQGLNLHCKDTFCGYAIEIKEVGEREIIRDSETFEKTEQGWRANRK